MITYNPFDNPEFRTELGKMFDDKLSTLSQTVDEHEAIIQRQSGALALASWLVGAWTVIIGFVEYMFHKR